MLRGQRRHDLVKKRRRAGPGARESLIVRNTPGASETLRLGWPSNITRPMNTISGVMNTLSTAVPTKPNLVSLPLAPTSRHKPR